MSNKNLIWVIFLFVGICNLSFGQITATERESPLSINLTATKTGCANDATGTASVEVAGGKPPYSYRWSNGALTPTITGLSAGNYFVEVTDANGVSKNGQIYVKATNKLPLDIAANDPACSNTLDGSITITPIGGTEPYSWQWGDGSNSNSLEGLAQGMYMVTVTDANGCTAEEMIMLMSPEPLDLDATILHVSCGATDDGYMKVRASGGTQPYSYKWALDGLGGVERINLPPGAYSVTVTDANGCEAVVCPEIIQSQPPRLIPSSRPATCPGDSDGRATVTPSNDSPPYRFEWPDNISHTSTAFNLAPGTYTVTVTNFRNCSATVDVVVGLAGGGFGFNISSNGRTCAGASNGQAAVAITGGVPPFSYQWQDIATNTSLGTGSAIDNLSAGTYEVTVTDANGCTDKQQVTIVEEPSPSVEAQAIVDEVCFEASTGSAQATATGGTGTITYQWSNGTIERTVNNLAGGTYQVTATDENGCFDVTSVNIAEREQLIISEEITDLKCFEDASGSISITVSGANGEITYLWSNNETGSTANNLKAGVYYVTATDEAGCEVIKGLTLNQPEPILITTNTTNAADLVSTDGKISIEVSGGTPPFSYEWSNGANTSSLDNLVAGTYSVTVTDANGCQEISSITVEATCTIQAVILESSSATCAQNDATATVEVSGAKGDISYQWSNGMTSSSLTGVVAGYYGVTVTDAEGCEAVTSIFLKENCDCANPIVENIVVFESECESPTGSIDLQMKGDHNNYNFQWSDANISGTKAAGLSAGVYEVTITDKNNPACTTIERVLIGSTNVGPVSILQTTPEICSTEPGSAVLIPSGLTYSWSDGGMGSFREDLAAGDYLVTVTNPGTDNCMDFLKVRIDQESSFEITPIINRKPECGDNNGSVTLLVSGGSDEYDFSWGNNTQNNLSAGTYDVTITDRQTGCTDNILFTLTNTGSEDVVIGLSEPQHISCVGVADGIIRYDLQTPDNFANPATVKVVDGKGYEYDANALPAGEFCLVAEDANGCLVGEACFSIDEPDLINVNVTVLPMTCNRNNSILLSTNGGNGQYTYNWADIEGEIDIRDRRNIENGTYTVTVTDEKGCQVEVPEISINGECFICELEATALIEQQPDCGQNTGSVSIEVENVFGNLTFSWGDSNQRDDLAPGNYTVTIVDDYRGCETTTSFTLQEPEKSDKIMLSAPVVCPGATGFLDYNLDNFYCEKAPLNVTIINAQGAVFDENALPADDYTFVLTDADGNEIQRADFTVNAYPEITVAPAIVNEGCTTPGSIDLNLPKPDNAYTFQWEDAPAANTSNRENLTAGNYRVTIIDNETDGCSIIRDFSLEKITAIDGQLEPEKLICDNETTTLKLEGNDLESFIWSPANLIVAGQGTAEVVVKTNAPSQKVTVAASNAFGCIVEAATNIISVNTNPGTILSAAPQCNGTTIDFSSDGPFSDYYYWDFGDGNTSDEPNPSHTYADAGDYQVQLKLKPEVPCADNHPALDELSVNLVDNAETVANFRINYDECQDEGLITFEDQSTANPGSISAWKWTFSNGMTSTEQNPSIELTEGAELSITLEVVSDEGCEGATSESQAFAVIHIPDMQDTVIACAGVPTQLNPNSSLGMSYSWSPVQPLDDAAAANPVAIVEESTSFTVQVTQAACVEENEVYVKVPAPPAYELTDHQIVCDDSEQSIRVNTPENVTVQWTNAQTGTPISSDTEITVAPGTYEIALTDENGCITTDEVVIENFGITASIIDNIDPCTDENGILTIENSGAGMLTDFTWNDQESIISSSLEEPSVEVEISTTTDFEVQVTNEYGCETTLTKTIYTSTVKNVALLPERDTIFLGESLMLQVIGAENGVIAFQEHPSLSDPFSATPTVTPESTTNYQLLVTDPVTGCTANENTTILVRQVDCGEPNIFFPNAFSPNGDGQNDVLYVRGQGLDNVRFVIFNRWGEKVFESFSQADGWDGTYNGEFVQADVYGYFLEVECIGGERFEKQGNVTVLR